MLYFYEQEFLNFLTGLLLASHKPVSYKNRIPISSIIRYTRVNAVVWKGEARKEQPPISVKFWEIRA